MTTLHSLRKPLHALAFGLACALPSASHAATPDLTGYWKVDRYVETLLTVDGKTPPLKPEASAIYKERIASRKAGNKEFDPVEKCISPGIPRVMSLPYAIEFLQRPKELTMLFAWNRLYRNIDLTGKQPVVDYPMYMGVGSGRVEGNSLVIDTVGLKEEALLDAAGLPGSNKLKVTERYTPSANGKKLTAVFTIDDPENYTQTWQTRLTYTKLPDSYEFAEDVCLDRIEKGQPAVGSAR